MTTYNIIMTIHVLAIAAMFIELVYVTTQTPSKMQSHVACLLITTLLMFVGYYIELKSTTIEVAYTGTVITYLGKPFILLYGSLFICDFYNVHIPKHVIYIENVVAAFISFSVYTSPYFHLYYKSWSFNPDLIYSPLLLERGPVYGLYLFTVIAFFVLSITVIVRELIRNRTEENRVYAFYFSMMTVSGLAGYLIYLSGISNEYDTTIFGLIGGIICLSILFFRYKIFDVLTIAKDKSLENSPTGLIIIDENKKVSYANKLGMQLLNAAVTVDELQEIKDKTSRIRFNGFVYEIDKSIVEIHGRPASTSFEFTDITISSKYQDSLETEVKQRTEKIETMQRKVINSFASVVEARSLETGEHIARTSEYVRLTIESLKNSGLYTDILTDDYVKCLIEVAPLHDIGKISISDSILLKPGRLNDEEFDEMKKHAEIGAQVIETTMKGVEDDDYVEMAMEVAAYHHEKWDGKGYPHKISGSNIPLSARIMAIADTYDALIAKRCYKDAYSKEKAMEIIREESGTHFDPDIAEAFLKAIENN